MKRRFFWLAALLLGLIGVFALVALAGTPNASSPSPARSGEETMADAASAFLASLNEEQRTEASFDFEDEERFNFHFIPRERKGLPLHRMTVEQRREAHDLLQSALSNQGYLKVTHIMHLESVLRAIEGSDRRDPELYYFSVFGAPDESAAWGWRVEGHHLSLNFSSITGNLSVTPAFYGSNPAEIRTGPYAGLRVLASEEDLGRRLVTMLSDEQRSRAVIAPAAPADIVTAADREARIESFEGLPAGQMTPEQKEVLWSLIEVFASNLKTPMAEDHLARIRSAGIDSLHFAWAGSLERGEAHYFRVHGPTDVFEYDNIQTNANHIHTVWRNFENDFGRDLLREHYDTAAPGHGH